MQSQSDKRKVTENRKTAATPRFKIEKLEERIAPAKGGIPGPTDHSNGGGGGHWDCNPHKERCV